MKVTEMQAEMFSFT